MSALDRLLEWETPRMHFSKTYSQLLLTLPPELQENAIEYRQLKKLINKVVVELASLGLSPSVLRDLLQSEAAVGKGKQRAVGERPLDDSAAAETSDSTEDEGDAKRDKPTAASSKAIYEFVRDGERIEPRLRLWVATTANDPVDPSPEIQNGDTSSHVAIFLDKPDSTLPSPTVEEPASNYFEKKNEDLLLVSKPLLSQPGQSLVWTLQKRSRGVSDASDQSSDEWKNLGTMGDSEDSLLPVAHPVELVANQVNIGKDGTRELIIPLASDTAFFDMLQAALQSLAAKLVIVRENFVENLRSLAMQISETARPLSETSRSFHPSSRATDPSTISTPLISPFSSAYIPGGMSKSDLYAWREIFQLYIETEVFESHSERTRGELDIAETEKRLTSFAERVTERGLSDQRKLKLKKSRDALEKFLELNVFIINLKKFQFANTEAARKILKKHTKRTALPFMLPGAESVFSTADDFQVAKQVQALTVTQQDILALIPSIATSLPHVLVQAIGETLLPIIPSVDDYNCLICYNIAFKPIRLACGHLFCVRCLVKMQKRGQDHCPCCRAPTVLKANRTNVDWALINFMRDWFPVESTEKLKQNEREMAQEELEEMGIKDTACHIM